MIAPDTIHYNYTSSTYQYDSHDDPRVERLTKIVAVLFLGDVIVKRFRSNGGYGPFHSVLVIHELTGWNVQSMIHKEYVDNLILACAVLYMAVTEMVGEFDDRWDGLLRVRRE